MKEEYKRRSTQKFVFKKPTIGLVKYNRHSGNWITEDVRELKEKHAFYVNYYFTIIKYIYRDGELITQAKSEEMKSFCIFFFFLLNINRIIMMKTKEWEEEEEENLCLHSQVFYFFMIHCILLLSRTLWLSFIHTCIYGLKFDAI